MSRPRRWAHSPLLHFALLGAALFAVRTALDHRNAAAPLGPREPIVVSGERVHALRADFVERWGRPPTPEEFSALVEHTAQDEMLYREARRLALDLGDGSVRRRLLEKIRAVSDRPGRPEPELLREAVQLGLDDDVVIRRLLAQKMRLVLQSMDAEPPPGDAEIEAWVEENRSTLLQPGTITFSQVFLAARPGTDRGTEARRLLAGLRSDDSRDGRTATGGAGRAGKAKGGDRHDETAETGRPGDTGPDALRVAELSDPFPLGTQLRSYTQSQVRGRFGDAFTDRIFALEPGAWSGPIASPYGLHLVRVEERRPERLPPPDALRRAALIGLREERTRSALARGLAKLRSLYPVRVEETVASTR